jgi:hypothetical protein
MTAPRKSKPSPIVHQAGAQFYECFVEGIKQRIRTAQIKAALAANAQFVLHYWEIGRDIVDAKKDRGYGKRIVEMLSGDLRLEFPEMTGLSALNLWRMRAFYLVYAASDQKLSRTVTKSGSARQKLKQPISESPVQDAIALQSSGQSHGEKLWPLMGELNLSLAK